MCVPYLFSCAFLWVPLIGMVTYCTISLSYSLEFCFVKEALAIRRIFSLVDMITKAKFSNSPNDFKIRLYI